MQVPPVVHPPFDGGPPCICCPAEVRNLYAVAHNAMSAYSSRLSSPERYLRRMAELEETLRRFKPLIDAHFADTRHAYGAR